MARKRTSFGGAKEQDGGLRMRLRMRLHGKESGLAHQHTRLDEFCSELRQRLTQDGARDSMSDFELFSNALDAHMEVEEEVYFPALHGVSPDSEPELEELVSEHHSLRLGVSLVEKAIAVGDTRASLAALEELAAEVSRHEKAEEELIERVTGPSSSRSTPPEGSSAKRIFGRLGWAY